jgi:hypothetical protein
MMKADPAATPQLEGRVDILGDERNLRMPANALVVFRAPFGSDEGENRTAIRRSNGHPASAKLKAGVGHYTESQLAHVKLQASIMVANEDGGLEDTKIGTGSFKLGLSWDEQSHAATDPPRSYSCGVNEAQPDPQELDEKYDDNGRNESKQEPAHEKSSLFDVNVDKSRTNARALTAGLGIKASLLGADGWQESGQPVTEQSRRDGWRLPRTKVLGQPGVWTGHVLDSLDRAHG